MVNVYVRVSHTEKTPGDIYIHICMCKGVMQLIFPIPYGERTRLVNLCYRFGGAPPPGPPPPTGGGTNHQGGGCCVALCSPRPCTLVLAAPCPEPTYCVGTWGIRVHARKPGQHRHRAGDPAVGLGNRAADASRVCDRGRQASAQAGPQRVAHVGRKSSARRSLPRLRAGAPAGRAMQQLLVIISFH